MPLTLPNLDDRTYADLVEEARALIPGLYPEWTNHNPSDPGITLIELFAWLAEMLIYRIDQVPDRHRLTFLRLLNGPERRNSLLAAATELDQATRTRLLDMLYGPSDSQPELLAAYRAQQRNPPPELVATALQVTIAGLRRRDRAITTQDFAALAQEAAPEIARVLCVARRDLAAGTEAERTTDRPGHMSVVVVPVGYEVTSQSVDRLIADGLPRDLSQRLQPLLGKSFSSEAAFSDALRDALGATLLAQFKAPILKRCAAPASQPAREMLAKVWSYLEERRMLTTRHHVVGPFYVPVRAQVLVARRGDARDEQVCNAVTQALVDALHPLTGGPDGMGWPFGRPIYVSELYALLEAVPGVDYVPEIVLASACASAAPNCIVAAQRWHASGDLIGLELEAHHLPALQHADVAVKVAPGFVPVRLTVEVRADLVAGAEPAVVRRALKAALRQRFSPLRNEPDGENLDGGKDWTVTRDNIGAADLAALRARATVITLNALRGLMRQSLLPFVAQEADVKSLAIDLQPDTRWVVRDQQGRDVGVGSRARELADLQVIVDLG